MKKVIWSAILLSVVALWFLPEAVTRPLFHLLVLGIIPGAEVEMGLIFPLALITVASFFLVRWIKEAANEIMEFKTKLALQEEVDAENQAVVRTTESADLTIDEEIEIISI